MDEIWRIFFGYAGERADDINRSNKSVAHYTSAEIGLNIIQHRSIWLRSASVMNDHMEIAYGKSVMDPFFRGADADKLCEVLNNAHEGLADELRDFYELERVAARESIFMTCLSEHAPEDRLGRLSMWRAYGGRAGGVAMIFKRSVVTETTASGTGLNVSPIFYGDAQGFKNEFSRLIARLEENVAILKNLDRRDVAATMSAVIKFALQSIKHNGFKEEREWRLLYEPSAKSSQAMSSFNGCVRGTPQVIWKLRFSASDERDPILARLTLDRVLERILIGPCLYPETVRRAFVAELKEAAVQDPEDKVHVSDIPLRQWG